MLREIAAQLPSSEQIAAVKTELDGSEQPLLAKEKEVDQLLADTPNSLELREQVNYWRSVEKDGAAVRRQLLEWANAAQSAIQQCDAALPQWNATIHENESMPGLGPALDVIRQSVADIQALRTSAQTELRSIVNLQIRAANRDQLATDVLDRLAKAHTRLQGTLLEQDSPPIWKLAMRREGAESAELFNTNAARMIGIKTFTLENGGLLGTLGILLLLSLFAAHRLYVATRHIQPKDEEEAKVIRISKHWFALGLLPPLLVSYALAPSAPIPLIGVVILISFIPILTLLPPLIDGCFRLLIYSLAAVYAFNAMIAWLSMSPAHKRELQFVSNLAICVLFAVLVRPARFFHLERPLRARQGLILGIRLAVGVLAASLIANAFGYVKLAQFLGLFCFYSTFIALSVFAGVRIFTLLLVNGIDTSVAQQLAVVRVHRNAVGRWFPRVLQWAGILMWLGVTLELLGIRDWVWHRLEAILDFHIAGTSTTVTLGSVLGFFLILLIGYAASSGLRFLLREEILNRFPLPRGVPELISSMIHYLLLILVFFFAVNLGGIDLNKITLLTGALGVGVGFGLQNVVNNFISGLILQFERPIHIGDVVELEAGATGRVTRIGIRSSTILTPQGAEIIIPNSNFISNRVTNWTLTEAKRRIELLVGVAYGSDLKLVMRLLNQAATIHESSLTSPAPVAYFKQFGDSSLDFELHFWVMMESDWVLVKSEVSLSVVRLLTDAGIEIPFPQRDLRLRSVDQSAAELLLGNATGGNGLELGSDMPQR